MQLILFVIPKSKFFGFNEIVTSCCDRVERLINDRLLTGKAGNQAHVGTWSGVKVLKRHFVWKSAGT